MELFSQSLFHILTAVMILLGRVDAKRHFISVGHFSNLITPDSIIASSGDEVEFQFPEGLYNIVRGEYSRPCRPLVEGSSGRFEGKELSSGPVGNEFGYDPEKYNTWTIKINGSNPIWFYDCHTCYGSMAGVINPPSAILGETLEEWKSKHDRLEKRSPLPTDRCFVGKNGNIDERNRGGRLGKKTRGEMEMPLFPMATTTVSVTISATSSATGTSLSQNNSGSGSNLAVSSGMLSMVGVVTVLAWWWRCA